MRSRNIKIKEVQKIFNFYLNCTKKGNFSVSLSIFLNTYNLTYKSVSGTIGNIERVQ